MNKELPFKLIIENEIEQWRADTFWDKEPETLAWIESFTDGVFYDIGANIGLYSLFCAKKHPKITIFSFEPQFSNYVRLCQNIRLNDFRNIIPVYAGIGHASQQKSFLPETDCPGSTGGEFVYAASAYSGMIISLTDFSSISGMPNYIKIDTDGSEGLILYGMESILRSQRIRSLLIELDTRYGVKYRERIDFIEENGFSLNNPFNTLTPHSRTRRMAYGIKVENLIFTRE